MKGEITVSTNERTEALEALKALITEELVKIFEARRLMMAAEPTEELREESRKEIDNHIHDESIRIMEEMDKKDPGDILVERVMRMVDIPRDKIGEAMAMLSSLEAEDEDEV